MSREVTSWIDIRYFGYFGDGINNDYPAFTAALDAMKAFGSYKGAALLLPPSIAYIPDGFTVVVPDGLEIEGAGDGQTVIRIGGDNPASPNTGFLVPDGSSAFFTNLTLRGPTVAGVTVLGIDKQGTTGTLYLTNVDAENPNHAGVKVAAGCLLELGDCAEVGNDFTTAQGAPITYLALGDGLWGGAASHQPRQIKGEVDPSAGGGVAAPQGSIYQEYAVTGALFLKTGAADNAWTSLSGGGPPPPTVDLQDAYNNGPAGAQIIALSAANQGILIVDTVAPQTPAFAVTNNAGTLTYYGLSAFGSAIAQDNQTGFPYQTLTIFPGALTTMTASAEWVGFDWFAGTKAKQWATGALAVERVVLFRASTLSFVGASVVGTAATVAITDAPTAGANATITNPYSLWCQAGLAALDGGMEMANASPAVSAANTGRLLYNSGTQTFQVSLNGAAYVDVATGVANTTLQQAYNNGAPGTQDIQTSAGQGGVRILDGAPGFFFDLFSVTSSTGLQKFLRVDGTFGGAASYGSVSMDSAVFIAGVDNAATALSVAPPAFDMVGTPQPATSGGIVYLATSSTHTNLSGEFVDVRASLARTLTWSGGDFATQRSVAVTAPTLAFGSAHTITTAATFAVSGPPVAGTNATLTAAYTIWAQSGLTALDGGMEMANTSPAVSAANTGRLKYNSGTQTFQVSLNGAAYTDISTASAETLQQAYTAGAGGTAGTITATIAKGDFVWTQGNGTAVNPTGFSYTDGSLTNITATNETVSVAWDLSSTKQHATGALGFQRAMRILAPTYSFVGASTISIAATVAISNAPIAGTNATLTSSYALLVSIGMTALNGGLEIPNTSPAVSAANTGRLKYNSGTQTFQVSLNGVAYVDLATATTATLQGAYNFGSGGTAGTVTATNSKGEFVWNQGVATTGSPTGFTYVDAAHTTLTASAEDVSVNWNLSSTKQFATGNIGTERAMRFQAPTYGFVGASTITTAATLSVSGPPIAGTNATITRSVPLWLESGVMMIGANIGALTFGTVNQGIIINGTGNNALIVRYATSPTEGFFFANTASVDIGTGSTASVDFYSNNTLRWRISNGNNGSFVSQTNASQVVSSNGAVGAPAFAFTGSTSSGFYLGGSNSVLLSSQGNNTWDWDGQGHVTAHSTATVNGNTTAFTLTAPANTNQTLSVEEVAVNLNLSATVQFATGALTTQRAMLVQAPTYGFVGASTITTAVTLDVTGPPVAGTNATITTGYALRSGGLTQVKGASDGGGRQFFVTGTGTGAGILITSTSATNGFQMVAGTTVNITNIDNSAFSLGINNGSQLTLQNNSGCPSFAPAATAGGSATRFIYAGATDTNFAASTEMVDINFNLARIMQHATGALATQRAHLVQAPTYSFVGASTITNAATFAVSAAPVAGTNATITNSWAIWAQAGFSKFDDRVFIATPNSAPTDANLSAASITWYLNEAGNLLTVRVKYTDGTTLKTGTIALV